jgi:copper transport protein
MRRLIVAAAAVAAIVLGVPVGPASAHAGLDESTPASGAVLNDSPTELVLDFDEPVEASLGGVDLTTSDGTPIRIGSGDPTPGDASRLVVTDVPPLADGVYVVVWQVTSADGHPARGAFTFQVGTASGGVDTDALIDEALAGGGASSAVTWSFGVARALAFAGVTVLIGSVLMQAWAGGAPGRRLRRTWAFSLAMLAIGSLGVFLLQGAYVTGGGLAEAFDPGLWADVAGTRLGTAVLVRLALVVAVAVLLRRSAPSVPFWSLASLALVATFSMTGHPSATSPAALAVAVDMAHLASVSVWLGGLVWLLVRDRTSPDLLPDPDVAVEPDLVSDAHPDADQVAALRFSRLATVAMPVIVVSGGWQTWLLLDSLSDLTETDWGRALLVKVAIVVVLVTLGGVSRWLLRHDGATEIRRLVISEVVIGAIVLGVTAGLVATPPVPPVPASAFTVSMAQGSLIADVSVGPGRVGSNEIHIVLSPPGGTLQAVVSAQARISLPAENLPAVPVVLTSDGPNHYIGTVQIPQAGDWTLDLIVEPQENSTVLLSTTLPIPG